MNRRDFIKLAGALVGAGALLPILGDDEMDLGDLLVKIAQNRNLTPHELDALKRIGTETQQRNSFVGGNTTASGGLNVPTPFYPIYSEVLQASKPSFDIQIPGGYNHLLLMGSVRCDKAAYFDVSGIQFNGDTGANYIWGVDGWVWGGVAGSQSLSASNVIIASANGTSAPANSAGGFFAFLPHVRGAWRKSVMSLRISPEEDGSSNIESLYSSGIWKNTSPITSLNFFPTTASNFVAGSIFSVYGIQ